MWLTSLREHRRVDVVNQKNKLTAWKRNKKFMITKTKENMIWYDKIRNLQVMKPGRMDIILWMIALQAVEI